MVCTRGFQRCFSACVFALNGLAAFYKKGVTVQLAVVKPTPLHPRLKNLANAGVPFVILTLLDMVFRSMTQPSVVSRLAVLVDIGYTWYIPTYTRYICIHIAVSKCSKTNPYISHIRKASSYSITNKNYLYVYIYICGQDPWSFRTAFERKPVTHPKSSKPFRIQDFGVRRARRWVQKHLWRLQAGLCDLL